MEVLKWFIPSIGTLGGLGALVGVLIRLPNTKSENTHTQIQSAKELVDLAMLLSTTQTEANKVLNEKLEAALVRIDRLEEERDIYLLDTNNMVRHINMLETTLTKEGIVFPAYIKLTQRKYTDE